MNRAFLSLLFLSLLVTSARAQPLVRDEFLIDPPNTGEYSGVTNPSTGSPSSAWLQGQGGGIGFTGTWDGTGNQFVVDSDTTLSIPGRASDGGNATVTFGTTPGNLPTRSFAPTVQATLSAAPEIWFSFLHRNDNAGGTNGLRLFADSGSVIGIEQRLDHYIARLDGSNSFNTGSAGAFTANQDHLLIGRLEIDRSAAAAETLSLWAITDVANFDINSPLETVSLDVITAIDPSIASAELFKNDAGFVFDSIRIGTDARSVISDAGLVAVPEPGSCVAWCVAGLFSLGIGVWTRRRSR